MKKIYFLLLVGLMLSTFVPAQVNNYLFAGSSGTFTSLVGGTLSTAVGDDGTQTSIPIGFTFMYNGTTFTTFGISTNGAMQLGATAPGFSNALVSNTNVIAPLWDDNNMTGGTITYATTGAVGARILTIEWTNMHVGGTGSTTNPTITLQVLLYETNGMVQIIYGATSGALLSTTASIGISGAVGNFLSVTPLSPPNTSTVSSVTENSTISSAVNFPSGTTYTFTPPPPCSGTPTGGTTLASLLTVCSGTTTVLSLSGATSGVSGLAYQWQSSPDNIIPYTNIGSAISSTYTATVVANIWYRCVVTCTNSSAFANSVPVQVTLLLNATPTDQPTGLILAPLATAINGSFTAAAGTPSGYLVVRYAAGASPTNPVNGTVYSAGNSLGAGRVVASSATTTFSATGIAGNYDFYVYSFNTTTCPTAPTYRTASPLTGTQATILSGTFSGSYTINPDAPVSATNFITWTDAFSALNLLGVTGPTTFTVTGTAATVNFNEGNLLLGGPYISGVPSSLLLPTLSVTNTLSFVAGPGKTINMRGTGVSTTIDYVFRLQGVDYVTFDGINIIDIGATITTQFEFGYVIGNSSNSDGANNNTIKNFSATLLLANTGQANGPYGVLVQNGTALIAALGTTGTYASRNNNNKIQNFTINGAKRGVSFSGLLMPAYDEGNEVSGNVFTSATGGTWVGGSRITNGGGSTSGTDWGVGIDGQKNLKVFNLQIDNFTETSASPALSGIHFGTAASTSLGSEDAQIYNCVIHNFQNNLSLASGVIGIRASGATIHTMKIYNNAIYDLRAPIATGANVVVGGLLTSSGTGTKIELYNNSVNLPGALAAAGISKGFAFGLASAVISAKNNAINFGTTGGGATGGVIAFDFGATAPTLLDFSSNIYNVGTPSATRRVAVYGSANRAALIDWQSTMATPSEGVDQRTGYGNPGFVSTTDINYGASNSVENSGVPVSGLSTANDILGVARSLTTPDLGVFEGNFSTGFVDVAASGILIAPLENRGSQAAEVRVMISDNVNTAANITARLWYRLGVAGIFTALPPDVAPAGNNNGEYRWGASLRALPVGTYQYYIIAKDAANNYFADPTMIPAAVSPGFASVPDPNWAGANPFPSAGVNTFQVNGAPLAGGTYNVGTTETYASLTAVAAELSTRPISGNVIFELTNNYTGAGEVYPIVFNQPSYTAAGPLTITIRPAASVVAERVTSGDPGASNALILLDGMRDMTLDGRPGGTGSSILWRITNARDGVGALIGPAFALQNDALRNSLKYLTIQSNSNTGNAGVINMLSTYFGGKGNSFNTIDHCDIGANTAGALVVPPNPIRGIAAVGGGTNSYNNGNTYSNNNIHDVHSLASNPVGIFVAGETGVTITGNSIYQTAARSGWAAFGLGIAVNGATGPGINISNNFIGGSAPLCAGGPMTISANTTVFYAIQVNPGLYTSASTISGNTITNMNLTTANTTSNSISACGINPATNSNQYPLTITNNIIGSTSVDALSSPAIVFTSASTAAPSIFSGIFTGVSGTSNISNNQIGGVKLLTTGTGTTGFIGIQHQTAGVSGNIDNNLIGSLATANNIVQNTNAQIVGISQSSTVSNPSISNNTIANLLYNATVGGSSQTFTGISGSGSAPLTIVGNSISDVVGNNHGSLTGISMTSSGIGTVIRGNTIRNFTINPQVPTTAMTVQGISTSSSSSTGVIEKNVIHSLINGSTSTGANLYGTNNQFGSNWTYSNNMISLGNGSNGDITIRGIYDFASPTSGTGGINYYYNTVSITGAAAAGVTNTYAYYNADGSGNGLKTFRNNIFSNNRTSGTGMGYAVAHPGSVVNASISSNYNDLFSATTVAQWQGTAASNNYSYAGWQAITGGDANGTSALPVFVSVSDMHLSTTAGSNWCLNGSGIVIPLITTDVDGNVRSVGVAPVGPDMGADEFVAIGADIATPASQTVCSANAITTIVLSGGAISYSWTRDNTVSATGIAASGTGNIDGTLTNTTTSPVTVTFTITPLNANGCASPSGTFTTSVLVNPTATAVATPASQTICSATAITTIAITGNAVAGVVYNWTRDNTVAVTGIATSGAGDISGTLTNTTTAPVTVTFTITPTANSCAGAAITATVLVNPTATAVATPSSQTVCSATAITTIVLSGNAVAGVVYNWTRDNTVAATGIATSGAGDISGTLTNTTIAPVTVTFTITPTANGCAGAAITATVLVNPTATVVATPASQTVCSATAITTIVLSGNAVAGVVYNWTRDNTAAVTGIAASGAGDISGTLTNTTASAVTVTFTITPTANGCAGAAITATVLVNPTPTAIATPASQTVCSGTPISTIAITGNAVAGVVYNWTRDNTVTATGIAASGAGDITGTLTNATASAVTVTFTITPTANGCPGTPITATVIVNALPVINSTQVEPTTCASADGSIDITVSGAAGPYTYAWTGSGVIPINEDQINLTVGSYSVTVTAANGCTATANFALAGPGGCSICPTIPNLTTVPSGSACAGNNVIFTASGLTDMGTTYGIIFKYSVAALANPYSGGTVIVTVPNGSLTSGHTIATANYASIPAGTYNVYAILTPTPVDPVCRPAALVNLSIGAMPDVNQPADQAVCNTTTTAPVNFTGSVPGTIFNWINNNASIGLAASGTGNIASFTATNASNAPVVATITVTPTLVSTGASNITNFNYTGTLQNWTVPVGVTSITINAAGAEGGLVTSFGGPFPGGKGATMTGTFSVTPGNTLNIIVGGKGNPDPTSSGGGGGSGVNLGGTALIVAGGGAGIDYQEPSYAGINAVTTNNGVIGSNSGGVGGAAGTDGGDIVYGSVHISRGGRGWNFGNNGSFGLNGVSSNTTTTNGTWGLGGGGGSVGIGFCNCGGGGGGYSGGGSGNINASGGGGGSFNSGTAQVNTAGIWTGDGVVSISYFSTITCTGTPKTFTITVNPTPNAVATPASQTICSGTNITTIALTSAVSGTTYNWTRDNSVTVTGIAASGGGNISGLLTNTTAAPITVTFTITPTANGCPGAPITATVLVNPTPNAVATPASQTICSAATITSIVLSGNVAGTVYNWSRDNSVTVTGIAASGTGNISGSLTNTTNAPVTVTFTITPTANGCLGAAITATVLVNPTPNAIATPVSQFVCSGNPIAGIILSGNVAGTVYNWTRDNIVTVTGIAASGAGNISGTFINTTAAPITVTFTITPTANGCPGAPITATVLVNPLPAASISYTGSPYCSGDLIALVTRTGTVGGTYSSTPGLTINAVTGTVTPNTSTPGIYTVTYFIAASGGCVSFTTTTTITITQNPNATIFYSGTPYCQNAGTANVTRFGTPGGTYSSTAGLIINASTGAVNLAASTPGTYIVSYTIAASGGCGVTVTTTNITITVAPVANISYTGSPYCSNAGTATVIQTGTTGGTYSSTVGLSINSVTGAIALGSSIPGSYTVTYTIAASGGCAVYATTTTITISALPAATISYAGSPYCQNAGTVSVTRTGTAGGTYSSTVGLTLNASTGDVNIATSTTGIYTVTYTLAAGGGCPVVTSTTSITITTLPSATISYAGNPYCQTAGTAIVTRTGTAGGVFSSTAGLTLNASTGDVTLGTSTPATYTVTYTLAAGGGCPAVTATASITVNSLSTAATTANTSAAAICGPGTVSLSVTGGSLGSGASWKWYSGSCGGTLVGIGATLNVTVNNTTTYFVRAEGTCNTTTCASVTITVNVQPTISLTATAPTSLFPYQTSTLTATVSPSNATNTTVWYRNGNVIPGATGLSLVAGVDALGLYTVRTTTTAGCTALSNSILIKDTANSRMFITPNPNNGQFKVLFYAGGIIQYGFNRRLLIFAENGQKVFDRSYPITGPWSSMDINARHLPKGIYVVMLADAFGNEVLATGRVVIQ